MSLAKLKKKLDSLSEVTFAGYPDSEARLAWKAKKILALEEAILLLETEGT